MGRYISSSEAVWRMLGISIHERYPPVVQLAVHLENGQRVYFNPDDTSLRERLAISRKIHVRRAMTTICSRRRRSFKRQQRSAAGLLVFI